MSFLSDIAELAKAGYTPQDVKSLLSLSKPQENLFSEAQPPQTAAEPTVLQAAVAEQTADTEADKPVTTAPKESEPPIDVPDYKALYEAEQEKVRDLQNKNNNIDVSGNNTTVTEEHLLDIVRSFC